MQHRLAAGEGDVADAARMEDVERASQALGIKPLLLGDESLSLA
jgi:hypothetical protein